MWLTRHAAIVLVLVCGLPALAPTQSKKISGHLAIVTCYYQTTRTVLITA